VFDGFVSEVIMAFIILGAPILSIVPLIVTVCRITKDKGVKKFFSISIVVLEIFFYLSFGFSIGYSYTGTYLCIVILNILIVGIIYFVRFFRRSNNKRIIIHIFISIVIITGGIYFYKHINANRNITVLNSEEIIKDFYDNGKETAKNYKGKTFEITEIIIDKASPKDYKPFWDASCIYFGDDSKSPIKIECNFDDIIVHDLEIGEKIIVKCRFKEYYESEYGNYIIFRKGEIIK
jgi:hypothetical protein